MASARWGKSQGAYEKWCFIFQEELPVVVQSNAPLSDAGFIRDVIAFAKENGLIGSKWHRKVTVSPKENKTVIISAKAAFAPELATTVLKEYTIFALIHAIETGEIENGTRCHCEESLEDINAALAVKGLCVKNYGGSLIEIERL